MNNQDQKEFVCLMNRLHKVKTNGELAVIFQVHKTTICGWRSKRHGCKEVNQLEKARQLTKNLKRNQLNQNQQTELVSNLWYMYLYLDSPKQIDYFRGRFYEGHSSWRYVASLLGITVKRIKECIDNNIGSSEYLSRSREIICDIDRPKAFYEKGDNFMHHAFSDKENRDDAFLLWKKKALLLCEKDLQKLGKQLRDNIDLILDDSDMWQQWQTKHEGIITEAQRIIDIN